jgi:hypothetical protein
MHGGLADGEMSVDGGKLMLLIRADYSAVGK